MNQEVKTEWLEALKSEAYAKGNGQLRNENKYCCLGVLCDLYGKKHGRGWKPALHQAPGQGEAYAFLTATCFLPEEVAVWSGLDGDEGENTQSDLAGTNDESDTFEPVIALIEKL